MQEKWFRFRRLINKDSGKMVLLPIDHGASVGPIEGLRHLPRLMKDLENVPLNGLIMHKGVALVCKGIMPYNTAVVLHLSCSVSDSPSVLFKNLVSSLEDAFILGAEAVSVHVNLSAEKDYAMLKDFGQIATECNKWRIPLLAMMYYRNEKGEKTDVKSVSLIARVAMELGADIVKVPYTGDRKSFEDVVASVNIPVVVAGGGLYNDISEFYRFVEDAMWAGAAGVAIGRNCFQRSDRIEVINNVCNLVHQNHLACTNIALS